jgi:hypothetical protein
MDIKRIRAVVIGKREDATDGGSGSPLMETPGIEDYQELPAFRSDQVRLSEDGRQVIMDEKRYEYGMFTGDGPLHRAYLSGEEIAFLISNFRAWNSQADGAPSIIFNDTSIFPRRTHLWQRYIDHFPLAADYDIVLLGNSSSSGMVYPHGKEYNECYYYLELPHYDIAGIQAYVVNPGIVDRLNEHLHFQLNTDNYLSHLINELKLRVLVANEELFLSVPAGSGLAAYPKTWKILIYSKLWHWNDELSEIPRRTGFEILNDRKCMDEADVVVFHMPTVDRADKIFRSRNKRKGQLWVFWTMECEVHFKWQYEKKILSLFDITMTYKVDSDVPFGYYYPVYYSWLRREAVPKSELANAFISSHWDKSGRVKILKELMGYINVHSFGKTLNNSKLENDEGLLSKANKIAGYKFSLAFENAIARDYVTEKFFHPLVMGSVPVYLGAPNVREFAPGDHCYIDVNDFPSVRALANYLIELDRDDVRYQEYLQWKKHPFRDEFCYKMNAILLDPFLRLYHFLERGTEPVKNRTTDVSLPHISGPASMFKSLNMNMI